MKRETLNSLIQNLELAVSSHADILREYISSSNVKTAGYIIPLIPPEITSALGIESLKLPEKIISGETGFPSDLYNAVILPESPLPCCRVLLSGATVYRIDYPAGHGEDAAVELHNAAAAILKELYNTDLKSIDISVLQKRCEVFEKLRRCVRNISALRQGNSSLLAGGELNLIFEAASIFPPETALELLSPLLSEMQRIGSEQCAEKSIKALIYGARIIPGEIHDYIESRGILIAEDDTCAGRRHFDISLNYESEFIFYELLDAYSYRPMSPCTRKTGERYELLYRLLRNFGINLLIFFSDATCGISSEDIKHLRIRMMRDGIDPLVIDSSNYMRVIDDYIGRLRLSP